MTRLLGLLLIGSMVLLGLAACGSDDSQTADNATDSSGQRSCAYPASDQKASKAVEIPPKKPVAADELTITTNRGAIEAQLDSDAAPCTVNSFVSLAKQGYFDDTKCHRLVPGFVLQCGDPTATGRGGPGYTFADELTGAETYPAGTLAMANTGPDSSGSQFFIVLADAQLDPAYTVFGKVDDAGLEVARAIEKVGTKDGSETPARDVVIKSAK